MTDCIESLLLAVSMVRSRFVVTYSAGSVVGCRRDGPISISSRSRSANGLVVPLAVLLPPTASLVTFFGGPIPVQVTVRGS